MQIFSSASVCVCAEKGEQGMFQIFQYGIFVDMFMSFTSPTNPHSFWKKNVASEAPSCTTRPHWAADIVQRASFIGISGERQKCAKECRKCAVCKVHRWQSFNQQSIDGVTCRASRSSFVISWSGILLQDATRHKGDQNKLHFNIFGFFFSPAAVANRGKGSVCVHEFWLSWTFILISLVTFGACVCILAENWNLWKNLFFDVFIITS